MLIQKPFRTALGKESASQLFDYTASMFWMQTLLAYRAERLAEEHTRRTTVVFSVNDIYEIG